MDWGFDFFICESLYLEQRYLRFHSLDSGVYLLFSDSRIETHFFQFLVFCFDSFTGDSSNGGRFAEELIEKCEMTIRYFAEVRGHLLSQVIFFTIFGCVVFGIIFACLEIDRDSNDQ